jgi:hypothetical protein
MAIGFATAGLVTSRVIRRRVPLTTSVAENEDSSDADDPTEEQQVLVGVSG